MARLSANGTEFCRLERASQADESGTYYNLRSIRSNGAVLRATRRILAGRPTTSGWKVALTRKKARTLDLTTPELLRDHYLAKGFQHEQD